MPDGDTKRTIAAPPSITRAQLRGLMETLGLGEHWPHLVTFNASPEGIYIEVTAQDENGHVYRDDGTNDIALHRLSIKLEG